MSADVAIDKTGVLHSCCCCRLRPSDRDLKSPYSHHGETEIYSDMIKECFEIRLSVRHGCGICEVCVWRLRDAREFKLQVQRSQAELQTLEENVKGEEVRVKLEKLDAAENEDQWTEYNDVSVELEQWNLTPVSRLAGDILFTIPCGGEQLPVKLEKQDEGISIEILVPGPSVSTSDPVASACGRAPTERDIACDITSQLSVKRPLDNSTRQVYSCEHCLGHKLYTKTGYNKHMKYHHKVVPQPLVCKLCNKHFKSSTGLMQHHLIHTGEKPYECDKCDRCFNQRSALNRHIVTAHTTDAQSYSCELCHKQFASSSGLKTHIVLMHTEDKDKPYTCDFCGKGFLKKFSLDVHVKTHTGEKPFSCDICDAKFALKGTLKEHILNHAEEKPFSCDVCDMRFNKKKRLISHVKVHTGLKPHSCDVCDRSFTHASSLLAHKRVHNNPFVCDICERPFQSNVVLQRHRVTHSQVPVRPFGCDECDARYTLKSSLKKHKVVSHAGKKLICNDCGKHYTARNTLIEHMRKHTGELPFVCDLCPRRFSAKRKLTLHKIRHLERPYACAICDKAFIDSFLLRNHEATHTGKLFGCDDCGKQLTSNGSLTRHKRRHCCTSTTVSVETVSHE